MLRLLKGTCGLLYTVKSGFKTITAQQFSQHADVDFQNFENLLREAWCNYY